MIGVGWEVEVKGLVVVFEVGVVLEVAETGKFLAWNIFSPFKLLKIFFKLVFSELKSVHNIKDNLKAVLCKKLLKFKTFTCSKFWIVSMVKSDLMDTYTITNSSSGSKSKWGLVHLCTCKAAANRSNFYVSGKNNKNTPYS